MKKILLHHNSFRPVGGTEKFLKQIYENIEDVKFEFLYTGSNYHDRGLISENKILVHRIKIKVYFHSKALLHIYNYFIFFKK